MKSVGIVLLVLVLLLVGLPLAVGMGMGDEMDSNGYCPACAPDAPISLVMCLAILSLFALAFGLSSSKVSLSKDGQAPSISLTSLFRPPRTV